MDHNAFLRVIRGESRGLRPWLLRLFLGLISVGYGVGVWFRNRAFDRGRKEIFKSELPVISIGNITLGGTGKTPMVEWVCRFHRARGIRVAILSRGYGGGGGMNDEARVLFENLPDVPHLQDKDRAAIARIAHEELESQLLVLDDGFQHRRLARDLDIVLLDALDPFGLGRLFPRGLLREPISSLKRAGVLVLSRADLINPEERAEIRGIVALKTGMNHPWVEARHAPTDVIDAESNVEPLSYLSGKKILAYCGIGNPDGFRRTLNGLGIEPVELKLFPDHHPYSADDFRALTESAERLEVDLILTTQKDLVKLREVCLGRVPVRALRIGLEIMAGREALEAELARRLPE